MAHRGPDDKALISAPLLCSLSACSRQAGSLKPPFETDRYVILMDGDANLERLAEDWASLGPACLRNLPGAFAFAIWDKLEQVLWLAHDPVGTRPSTTLIDNNVSPSAVLRPAPGLLLGDREIAADYLAGTSVSLLPCAPRTLLATSLRCRRALPSALGRPARAPALVVTRLVAAKRAVPEFPIIVDRVDSALRRAVERRLRTHLPVGILLSGGLDSAAILHHASALWALRRRPTP